ncbi:GntR family transcriptional regulator [Coraliomargarita parva]|uniref:GntR family transcriptional regulator n=1 Tax=Coraliomargarita parva TaxID=3014050 RepID=UPI0022B53D0C|nr:GntR family transcriptional regulator [Coraliomargarita parva]
MTIESNTTDIPLHQQIQETILNWIAEGRYLDGDQLPSAREISENTGIKEQTVRRAIKRLIDDGTLRGAQGKGVFVSSSTQKHQRIALVLPNLEDELTRVIARGAQSILDKHGLQTLILDAGRNAAKEDINIENLSTLPIDGAIIFPITFGNIAEHIVRLKDNNIPFILIDKYLHGISCDCILADDYGGSYALTERLTKQGYRRFAWLSGEETSSTVEDRLDGFRWALGDQGIAIARKQVRRLNLRTPTEATEDRVGEEIDNLLSLPPESRPEVIVCANDLLAIEAKVALNKRGLRVPQDISLTGFDDLQTAQKEELTSVHKPILEMGSKAAEILLSKLTLRNSPPEKIVLPCHPIFRESTADKT